MQAGARKQRHRGGKRVGHYELATGVASIDRHQDAESAPTLMGTGHQRKPLFSPDR